MANQHTIAFQRFTEWRWKEVNRMWDNKRQNNCKDVYSVSISSDIIRGRNNLGQNQELNNLSSEDLINIIKDYTDRFGSPTNYSGMLVWSSHTGDTYSINAYKSNVPFNPSELGL